MKFPALLGMAILSALAGSFAQAAPGEFSLIERPTMICQNEGGLVAINAAEHRIWQGEPGEETALELEVLNFSRLRCLACFDITARMEMGRPVNLYYETRSEMGERGTRVFLTIFMKNPRTGDLEQIARMPCKKAK